MTLTQLEIFLAVAERGDFAAAAASLSDISESGVSHAIEALEQEFGVGLFHRHQRRMELTDIGMRLLQRARAILGLAEYMRQEASDSRGIKKGTLRIGSFGPTSSLRLLPAILDKYRKYFPDIEIYVDEGSDKEVIQWLTDYHIDVGFVTLPNELLSTFPLIKNQLLALIPANHPLASHSSVSLKDLCAGSFAITKSGSEEFILNLFQAARLKPNVRYRTSQLADTIATVARGDAVTILNGSALPRELDPRCVIRPLNPPASRDVALAVVDERRASPAAKAFIRIATGIFHPIKSTSKTPGSA